MPSAILEARAFLVRMEQTYSQLWVSVGECLSVPEHRLALLRWKNAVGSGADLVAYSGRSVLETAAYITHHF